MDFTVEMKKIDPKDESASLLDIPMRHAECMGGVINVVHEEETKEKNENLEFTCKRCLSAAVIYNPSNEEKSKILQVAINGEEVKIGKIVFKCK